MFVSDFTKLEVRCVKIDRSRKFYISGTVMELEVGQSFSKLLTAQA